MAAPEGYEGPARVFDEGAQEAFKNYTRVPAWYTIPIVLGGDGGAQRTGNTQLRPEPFVLYRISWATTADVLTYTELPGTMNASIHGRAVEMRWGDSFTTFLGLHAGLVTAVLGDSNGFLDIPRGALFQGSQPIEVSLTRLFWPGAQPQGAVPPSDTEWDFVFAGIGLLPAGVNQSGSAG